MMKRIIYEEQIDADFEFEYSAPIWSRYEGKIFLLDLYYNFADVLKKIKFQGSYGVRDDFESLTIIWFHDMGLYSYKFVQADPQIDIAGTIDINSRYVIDKIMEREFQNGIDDSLLKKVMDTLKNETRIKSIKTDLQHEE